MAASRASTLLVALVGAIVLFAVFALVINLSFLSKYSYDLGYGWQTSPTQELEICHPPPKSKGFPIKTWRQNPEPIAGCTESTNALAKDLNLALCFAAAAIIAGGIASTARNRS